MKKNNKTKYTMTDEDLKALKNSIEYVKNLDNLKKRKENIIKIKKVA